MNAAAQKPLAKALHTVTVVTRLALELRRHPLYRDIATSPSHLTAAALKVLGYTFDADHALTLTCQKAVDSALSVEAQQVATAPKADVYDFHSDPGHGWMAVPLSEVKRLGIAPLTTAFSYIDADAGLAYLEEDCDVDLFGRAKRDRGEEWRLYPAKHTSEGSFIRTLPGFTSDRMERALRDTAMHALGS